jgi:hypothetical protein
MLLPLREQIKLQVALVTPLMHVKGYAAPETKAALGQARLFIEQSEALGEPAEDPLLLFSVLYGFWVANHWAFHGDVCRDLAAQFLTLAEKQTTIVPLMIGHRLMGNSLLHTGDIVESRLHYDQAIALYDPAEHRPLATRFGQDAGVTTLVWRSQALWALGYPQAALSRHDLSQGRTVGATSKSRDLTTAFRDTDSALKNAREMGQAAALMPALTFGGLICNLCRNYTEAIALAQELMPMTGRASEAIEVLTSVLVAFRDSERLPR